MKNPEYTPLPALILSKDARPSAKKERKKKQPGFHWIDYEQVERLASAGLTKKQFSISLGVSINQINKVWSSGRWQDAVKRGRDNANAIVQASLFQIATGFRTEESKYKVAPVVESRGSAPAVYKRPDVEDLDKELVLIERTVKHIAPNAIACFYWLSNRDSERWKDIKNVVTENKPVQVEGMPTDLEGLQKLLNQVKRMKEQKQTEEQASKLSVGPEGVKVSPDGERSAPTEVPKEGQSA